MKPRGLWLVALAILSVTASSAVVASAQDGGQQAQSADLALPTNTTGNFDTGNKQISIHKPGETNTNSSNQTVDQQRCRAAHGDRRERFVRLWGVGPG